MAGVTDSGEGRFGRKPRARRDVKDLHTRCDMAGPQQEGHEMRVTCAKARSYSAAASSLKTNSAAIPRS